MPFKLDQVDPAKDFDELIACEWIAHENPDQPFFRLFCPVHGDGAAAREEWLKESTDRQRAWAESDPHSTWLKVVDIETGALVGGALWKIYEENPFAKPDEDDHTVTWYPDDSTRDFVSQALEIFDAPRGRFAQRPHVFLDIIFTHPDYRRQGVAQMMMDWGLQKAKDLGLEVWLNSTPYGVSLYKKNGFTVIHENIIHPKTSEPDEKWKKIEKELLPITFWQMWLPQGGVYEEGKTVKPWETNGH